MSVREAQEKIDSREFSEWFALQEVEPFAIDRIEFYLANLCAMIYNANRGNRPAKSLDFFYQPWNRKRKRVQSEEQMKAVLNQYTNAFRQAKAQNHGNHRNPQRRAQGNDR